MASPLRAALFLLTLLLCCTPSFGRPIPATLPSLPRSHPGTRGPSLFGFAWGSWQSIAICSAFALAAAGLVALLIVLCCRCAAAAAPAAAPARSAWGKTEEAATVTSAPGIAAAPSALTGIPEADTASLAPSSSTQPATLALAYPGFAPSSSIEPATDARMEISEEANSTAPHPSTALALAYPGFSSSSSTEPATDARMEISEEANSTAPHPSTALALAYPGFAPSSSTEPATDARMEISEEANSMAPHPSTTLALAYPGFAPSSSIEPATDARMEISEEANLTAPRPSTALALAYRASPRLLPRRRPPTPLLGGWTFPWCHAHPRPSRSPPRASPHLLPPRQPQTRWRSPRRAWRHRHQPLLGGHPFRWSTTVRHRRAPRRHRSGGPIYGCSTTRELLRLQDPAARHHFRCSSMVLHSPPGQLRRVPRHPRRPRPG
ncbi:uncharacterized protein [Aegilops tauschii subsp. strangulata]|uniref:uncharacterized protein n=1 Tax=Aegilops tauschii subsp. strangulata TaxID=200361 RepID=UPI003A65875E